MVSSSVNGSGKPVSRKITKTKFLRKVIARNHSGGHSQHRRRTALAAPAPPRPRPGLAPSGVTHWSSLRGLMLVRGEAANQRGLAPPTQPAPGGVVGALPLHAGNCSPLRPSCFGRKRIKNYSPRVAERGAVSLLRIPNRKPGP